VTAALCIIVGKHPWRAGVMPAGAVPAVLYGLLLRELVLRDGSRLAPVSGPPPNDRVNLAH